MKKISALLAFVLISSTVQAGILDGMTYCQIDDKSLCVEFVDDVMIDRVSLPASAKPSEMPYAVLGGKIVNADTGVSFGYELHNGGDTLTRDDGMVFTSLEE
ncbi:MAG: hypothetical protein H7061_14440 [Bdellovibrionaceae bacterium]|nr:hypothetical protein [Bdellovibrio sp.]